ncbi:unnamed protein product [Cuscuta europaea]|uniref:Secreted protein n=1 Tax=Cuscuta europaea TaxID=41803 RepID=A0A9P0ZYK5_CUSEU|nr:unnamed protein product [Cuscuta europaea]
MVFCTFKLIIAACALTEKWLPLTKVPFRSFASFNVSFHLPSSMFKHINLFPPPLRLLRIQYDRWMANNHACETPAGLDCAATGGGKEALCSPLHHLICESNGAIVELEAPPIAKRN